jgi:hypothetical protein
MKNNNNRRLAVPGEVNVGVQQLPGANAFPAIVPMQQPGSLQILMVGGASRVEQIAGQIVAQNPDIDVDYAVSKAREIIEACSTPPPSQPEPGLQVR